MSMTLKETLYFALGTLKGLHAGLDEDGQYHVKDPIRALEDEIERMDREEFKKIEPKIAKGLLKLTKKRGELNE